MNHASLARALQGCNMGCTLFQCRSTLIRLKDTRAFGKFLLFALL